MESSELTFDRSAELGGWSRRPDLQHEAVRDDEGRKRDRVEPTKEGRSREEEDEGNERKCDRD